MKANLNEVANTLPASGYTMGELITITVNNEIVAECDRRGHYKGCNAWKATHGKMALELTANEADSIQLGNLYAYIPTGNTKYKDLLRCRYVVTEGNKGAAKYVFKSGYVDLHNGHINENMQVVIMIRLAGEKRRKEAKRQKALDNKCMVIGKRQLFSQNDLERNGLRYLLESLHLDASNIYTGSFLLKKTKDSVFLGGVEQLLIGRGLIILNKKL